MFNDSFNSCRVPQNTNYNSYLMFLCMLAIKKNPLNYVLPVKQKALYPHLPCFSLVLPCGVFSQQLSRKYSFPFAIFRTFMFLRRQAGSQCRDLEAFPANCQLVNLIGLSPWAPFLNQLGSELAVTSFSQAGCLEAHHPGEVKHPNGKMLTSTAESYHILKVILYNYCKISSRKKARLYPSLAPSLCLCSPLCKNMLFSIASWFSALPLFFSVHHTTKVMLC